MFVRLEDKIIYAYRYALANAYRFERIRYYRRDLAHEAILRCIEDPNFKDVVYINTWVYRIMQNIYYDSLGKASNRNEKHNQEKYYHYAGNQISNVELKLDTIAIMDYVRSSSFNCNNYKGNTIKIFNKYIKGYTPAEIALKLGIKRESVNISTYNTRNKIKNKFGQLSDLL